MPNIQSLSALRNYSATLEDVKPGKPLFLTRNGKGRYAVMDIDDYEALKDALWSRLFSELDFSIKVAELDRWISEDNLDEFLEGEGI